MLHFGSDSDRVGPTPNRSRSLWHPSSLASMSLGGLNWVLCKTCVVPRGMTVLPLIRWASDWRWSRASSGHHWLWSGHGVVLTGLAASAQVTSHHAGRWRPLRGDEESRKQVRTSRIPQLWFKKVRDSCYYTMSQANSVKFALAFEGEHVGYAMR